MVTGNTLLDDRTRIGASIKAFRTGALADNAIEFFDALGYRSRRTEDIEPNTAEGLLELVNRPDFFNRAKARPEEWASIDLLFQLTDEEVRNYGQTTIDFDTSRIDVNSDRQYASYLFFAIQLKQKEYPRTVLADITREINRLFYMPALILFKHGDSLTLSVINRRLHKRDPARDVLKKVTLIKDIRVENPHRAHVEILLDLAFPQLIAEHKVTNFVELHDAWRKTLDISELNKRFYRDLANWYFWAREQVKFPAQPGVTEEANRSTNIIRLITRLTFVWFLKERGLVPDDLFRRETLEMALTDLSPGGSTFYKAILQNLFFATLNTPMSDAANPREFRTETEGKRHNGQYMVHTQYRHKKLFRDPEAALGMFASVPFLNGGLFECLDKREEVDGKLVETRVDGFSDLENKQPTVPNRLFFCEDHSCADDGIDLNAVYGTRNRQYQVRGLIDTLNRYKFTVAENTPIDEEVALDPELLGKVFENLLASYNPETGATARKQTGSFYTPRGIVNYMVDESLITYLETRLAPAVDGGQPESSVMRERDAQGSHIGQQPLVVPEAADARAEEAGGGSLNSRLRQLFAYTDEPHGFTEEEVARLIRAIDEVKILDPATGSGAYPMGILGKLVFILSKLDPQNAKWKQRQIDRVRETIRAAEKIEDDKFRESTLQDLQAQIGSIEEAFRNNELDYGRKLFLIENCIYGVDIQPIAIQISKLRFFISLIIDQRIRPQAENLGIRPLPNLETKFVAANTLLGIEKPAQSMLQNEELRRAIEEKERELKFVRERHFTARTTRTKEKYRKEDERLRHEIGELLEADNWSPEVTAKLIKWNPYDQNSSADFFDEEWMFSVNNGFEIVIGNPPWGAELTSEEKKHLKIQYPEIDSSTPNSFAYFIGKAMRLFKSSISVVLPDSILIKDFAKCRRLIAPHLSEVIWYQNIGTPEEKRPFVYVEHDVCVLMLEKETAKTFSSRRVYYDAQLKTVEEKYKMVSKSEVIREEFDYAINLLLDSKDLSILEKISKHQPLDEFTQCHEGIHTGNSRELLFHPEKINQWCKPLFYGGGAGDIIENYSAKRSGWFVDYRTEVIDKNRGYYASLRDERIFKYPKIYITRTGNPFKAFLDDDNYASNNFFSLQYQDYRLNSLKSLKVILPFIISPIAQYFIRRFAAPRLGNTFVETKILHLLKFRIPKLGDSEKEKIEELVNQILVKKGEKPSADTNALEKRLHEVVYQLYNLTPDEIEVIEASARR